MAELLVKAEDSNLGLVLEFIHKQIKEYDKNKKIMMQMDLAVEEIFINISHYAYKPGNGDARIVCQTGGELKNPVVKIEFYDEGIAFDPLEKEDPDTSLPAEERDIGGLGIFLVKKYMDFVSYERKGNLNVFTMTKKLV